MEKAGKLEEKYLKFPKNAAEKIKKSLQEMGVIFKPW